MRNAPIVTAIFTMVMALPLSSTGAFAQTGSAEALMQSFSRCRAIAAVEPRLECFDKAAQALEKAVAARDVTIVNRQEVRTAQRSLFGFNVSRMPIFGGGDRENGSMKRDPFDRLETTVVSTQARPDGTVQLKVDEGGAVWITADPMPFPPRAGTKVTIERGSLGNYFINAEGQRSVRGTRLR